MDADQQYSHFKSTSDHLLPSNGRAVGWILISRILIGNKYTLDHLQTFNGKAAGWILISRILIANTH